MAPTTPPFNLGQFVAGLQTAVSLAVAGISALVYAVATMVKQPKRKPRLGDVAMFALVCAATVTGLYIFGRAMSEAVAAGTRADQGLLYQGIMGISVACVSVAKAIAMWRSMWTAKGDDTNHALKEIPKKND